MDYNRWDNFEYFTPVIEYSQKCWLHGDVPYVNPHQYMGEPILATGMAGSFYFPYLICTLIVEALNLPPGSLCLVIVCIHLPLAAIGWFLAMRDLDIRTSVATIAATGICFGGFITTISTVWIFMTPVFAMLPWLLWGSILIARRGRSIKGGVVLVFSLALTVCVGHPQMAVYAWLIAALYSLLFSLVVFRRPRAIFHFVVLFGIAGLLSLPVVLPMLKALSLSCRAEAFGIEQFLERSLSVNRLVGLVLPVLRVKDGPLLPPSSMWCYQGAWIIPSLLGGFAAWSKSGSSKKSRKKAVCQTQDAAMHLQEAFDSRDHWQRRAFWVTMIPVLVFAAFSLGGSGIVYKWTYGIPVWSSFRWPFKFCCFWLPALALSASLGFELWAKYLIRNGLSTARRCILSLIGIVLVVSLLVGMRAPGWSIPHGVLCLATALPVFALMVWVDRNGALQAILLLTILSSVFFLSLCHTVGYKRYDEEYRTVGSEELKIDDDYRILPLGNVGALDDAHSGRPYNLQWFGLGLSATANGYYSVTGIPFGLIPLWYNQDVPSSDTGGLLSADAPLLFNSHLLRSFNVRYIIATRFDGKADFIRKNCSGYDPVLANHRVVVFANSKALPRAYCASHTYPFNEEEFRRGMLENAAPLRSAFVEGFVGEETQPAFEIESVQWSASSVAIDVNAPAGGFLVMSMSDYPDWRVQVDGRASDVLRVNRRIMGVQLEPGVKKVLFSYRSLEMYYGIVFCMLGFVLLVLWAFFFRANRQSVVLCCRKQSDDLKDRPHESITEHVVVNG